MIRSGGLKHNDRLSTQSTRRKGVIYNLVERNPGICVWCANKGKEVCGECQDEGKYRCLEPEALPAWESPPELPSYRQLVDAPAPELRAIIWLHSWYQDSRNTGSDI